MGRDGWGSGRDRRVGRAYCLSVSEEAPFVDHPRVRSWLRIREPLERQLEPLGRAAMETLALKPGERVLDVGCGIGGTPAALAEAVGTEGRVVGLDLLQSAVDVARRTAGLPQTISFLCGDAQTYPFEAKSFDAVFSRFGMMFFDDPAAAFRNMRRAMRPGGRLGFVCWRGLEENELDELPVRVAARHLPANAVSDTARAGWFSFADRAYLQTLLVQAGFTALEITPHDAQVSSGSLHAMVEVCAEVGALGAILRHNPDLRPRALAALEQALAERDGPAGPELRAAVWIVAAKMQG